MTEPNSTKPLRLVFEPLTIGPVRVANRIVSAAHNTGFGALGISDDFIAYHEARARGGVGLIILEQGIVHQSSPRGIDVSDDAIVDGYRELMRRLERYDVRVFQQLGHAGRNTLPRDGGPPWGISPVPGVDGRFGAEQVPLELDSSRIAELVEAFASATRRVRAGGLYGVQLQASHGFLLDQSLSPLANRRTDEYGGSAAKRLRLTSEILTAVRAAAGPGLAVGARFSAEEATPGGRSVADTVELVQSLVATGNLDFVDVTLGQRDAEQSIGATHEPHGYQLGRCAPITRAAGVPGIVTGRITSLAEAEEILAAGQADLVSLVRAQIADPDLVRKSRAGNVSEIRPCIGCNHGCVGGTAGPSHRIGCVVNPSAGREVTLGEHGLRTAARPTDVIVVGGGPAGLEAARVAALRGHRVTLCEERMELGGQVAAARKAPLRAEIGLAVDWLTDELARLGVEVRTATRIDLTSLAGVSAGAVIVATGSAPRRDGFQIARPGAPIAGMEGPGVFTSEELLEDPSRLSGSIVIADDLGHYEAIAVADTAIEGGAAVHFVTRFASISPLLETSLSANPARARLIAAGATIHPSSYIVAVEQGRIVVGSLDSDRATTVEADTFVHVTSGFPRRGLYDKLRGTVDTHVVDTHLVGDALSPRFLLEAFAEGNRAGHSV